MPHLERSKPFWTKFGISKYKTKNYFAHHWIQMHPVFCVKARGDPVGRLIVDYSQTMTIEHKVFTLCSILVARTASLGEVKWA